MSCKLKRAYCFLQIWRNAQRPQKLLCTELHLNQVTPCIWFHCIGSAILNFEIFTSDSTSAISETPEYRISSKSNYSLQLGPPYWIRHYEFSKCLLQFRHQQPQKPLRTKFHLNHVTFYIFARHFGFEIRNWGVFWHWILDQLPQKYKDINFSANWIVLYYVLHSLFHFI